MHKANNASLIWLVSNLVDFLIGSYKILSMRPAISGNWGEITCPSSINKRMAVSRPIDRMGLEAKKSLGRGCKKSKKSQQPGQKSHNLAKKSQNHFIAFLFFLLLHISQRFDFCTIYLSEPTTHKRHIPNRSASSGMRLGRPRALR